MSNLQDNHGNESREESPEFEDGAADKRTSKKRKVLSCFPCRNRKMKCDRVYPVCGRCKKTGRADQCNYDPRLLEDSHANSDTHHDLSMMPLGGSGPHNNPTNGTPENAPYNDLQWKIRVQERKIRALEQQLETRNGKKETSFEYDPNPMEEPTFGEEVMFRGKESKTVFHGLTSIMSLISKVRSQLYQNCADLNSQ